MKFYLIGIKGSGMAALALLLKSDQYEVVGKDVPHHLFCEDELVKNNIDIFDLDDTSYKNSDIVIIGHNFYKPELIEELERNKQAYFEYHHFLAFYLPKRKLIAISGSHGKTTTVKLLKTALEDKASYLQGDGSGKRIKDESYFILEACEYKDHFLAYTPHYSIVTNVDYDHVDYFKSVEQYEISFLNFINQSQKSIVDYDFAKKYELSNVITIGFDKNADYTYKSYQVNERDIEGIIVNHERTIVSFKLPLMGIHFLHHLLSIAAILDLENLDVERGFKNLTHFKNATRRFAIFEKNNFAIIDDYAHHPNQINANVENVKLRYPSYKHYAFFKPDRKSRFEYFMAGFKSTLEKFDKAFIFDLPINEENKGVDIKMITCEKIIYIKVINELDNYLNYDEKATYSLMSSKSLDDIKNYLLNHRSD